MVRKTCKWYQVCPMKIFYEQGLLDKKWVENYCFSEWQKCKRFEKEEAGVFHQDNMLTDGKIDKSLFY